MISHIYVGYDGTEQSVAAVEWAVNEALRRGSPLEIVTSFDIPVEGDAAYGPKPREDIAVSRTAAQRIAVAMQAAIAAKHPGLDVTVRVSPGAAALELRAEASTADMIVIGASTYQGTKAVFVGSTGRELARHLSCPLVVVRGAVGQEPSRLVVGVGTTPGSTPTLRWAGDEAELRGVELRLLHVWEPEDSSRDDARAALDEAADFIRSRNAVTVQTDLVERSSGLTFAEILAPDELLVIGPHSRGKLTTALFGSTVNNLIEQSPATVVIVPRSKSA